MNSRDYKCTTRAGVLKRIAGLEHLLAVYVANPFIPKDIRLRVKRQIASYKRQLEDFPLKRKKITL